MKGGMAFTVDTGKRAHGTNEPGYQMVSGIMNLRRNLCDSAGSLLPNALPHSSHLLCAPAAFGDVCEYQQRPRVNEEHPTNLARP